MNKIDTMNENILIIYYIIYFIILKINRKLKKEI